MEDIPAGDELAYSQEEVEKAIIEAIESCGLGTVPYDEAKVPIWINQICEKCMETLVGLEKPFKYLINCMIMQRNGAAAYVTSSCHWETGNDGAVIYQWPKDKQTKELQNRCTMQCTVSVFAISLS